jgi:PAS domain S-box-containing protein
MIQESLQKSVDLLQEENDLLRAEIVKHLGPSALPTAKSPRGTSSSSSADRSPPSLQGGGQRDGGAGSASEPSSAVVSHPLSNTATSLHYNLVKALQTAQQNFTITDPSLPDNPIIYASHGFLALTGYALDQVLGRNCRFLQGAQTDPRAIETMRSGMRSGLDTTTVILNYHYDGTPFWNQLFIGPLKDSNGTVVNYLGVQCKVSDRYAEAFFKTPNSSTISVANINTIYSSVMTSSSYAAPSSPSSPGTRNSNIAPSTEAVTVSTEEDNEEEEEKESREEKRLKRRQQDS